MTRLKVKTETIQGFTLLEIMMVLLIMSIILSFISFRLKNYSQDDVAVKKIAYEMYSQLLLAKDQAVLQGSVFAFNQKDEHWQLWRLSVDANGAYHWKKSLGSHKKTTFNIPSNIANVNLTAKKENKIIFFPDGNVDPFKLTIQQIDNNTGYQITGSENGEIRIDEM